MDPENKPFYNKLVIFQRAVKKSHPLIYLKMPFSDYFIDGLVIFKVSMGLNRVQIIPSTSETIIKLYKNGRKSRLIEKYTPMGFSRSLGYNGDF